MTERAVHLSNLSARRLVPAVAVGTFVLVASVVTWSAVVAGTFGFDFLAYHQAANRLLAGLPLYDPALRSLHAGTVDELGATVPFLYPPPFALAMVPFALVPSGLAAWLWLGASIASIAIGIALMPVPASVRWITLLLAGLSWPVVYSLKLGQVGSILFLLFAIGWRWLDRPAAIGASSAVGALIKIQPGVLLGWALLTRRWRAVVLGIAVLAVGFLLSIIAAGGVADWNDYLALLRGVGDPIVTPNNLSPGAVAYRQFGASPPVAAIVQVVSSVAAAGIVVIAATRATGAASYLTAVIASQLLSPVLWDHYAMLLLLPVAWLLARGQAWSVVIPLATSVVAVFFVPAAVYPAAFWVALLAVLFTGTGAATRNAERSRERSS